ncbi:hypothetical protein FRB98_002058 [Tulasnella sp. 332]|nr:hypothetical protein FRB98_002058 [Tulasnella sp. 332]
MATPDPSHTSSTPSSTSSTSPAPTSNAISPVVHNTTLTDASALVSYGNGELCTAVSCPATATIDPWTATWGQDNLTTQYFTYHATNQALARESQGIPYLTFNFNGSAVYLYVITNESSLGVFNISTNGGATYDTVSQTVTTPGLEAGHLAWYATGLDPTIQSTLVLRFWADSAGPSISNGPDANGACLNIQSFVITQPGPDPNSVTSTSSLGSSTTSSAVASSTVPNPFPAIYAASNSTAMILGLAIGLPLFFIFLLLLCLFCLCFRRRRQRKYNSGSDSEKHPRSMNSFLAGGTRSLVPSRHRGGGGPSLAIPAATQRRPPMPRAPSTGSSVNGHGGGSRLGMSAAAAMPAVAAAPRVHRDADDDTEDDLRNPGVENTEGGMSSGSLFGKYPGYSPRPPAPPRPDVTSVMMTAGPLLVPREGIASVKSQKASAEPFVLGLGETKKEARARRKFAERPMSMESHLGGSSGDEGGEESQADLPPEGSRAVAPVPPLPRREVPRDSIDTGISKREEVTPAARVGKASSFRSGAGGGFVNSIDNNNSHTRLRSSTSITRSHRSDAAIKVSSPRFDGAPRIQAEPATPITSPDIGRHGGAGGTEAGLSVSHDDSSSASPNALFEPSPVNLFDDDAYGGDPGPTPNLLDNHSPMPSTPEPMPKSPLEYYNESQYRIRHSSLGGGAGSSAVSAGLARIPSHPVGRERVGLGIGLASPAPTVDGSSRRPQL